MRISALSLYGLFSTNTVRMDMSEEDSLRRRRERERERRACESAQEREDRLSHHRLCDQERARQRETTETTEEREARLARRRVRDRARRAAASEERLEARSRELRLNQGGKGGPATGATD